MSNIEHLHFHTIKSILNLAEELNTSFCPTYFHTIKSILNGLTAPMKWKCTVISILLSLF